MAAGRKVSALCFCLVVRLAIAAPIDAADCNGNGIEDSQDIRGFLAPRYLTVGLRPVSIAAGDFDGDGRLDIVTTNEGSGDVSVLWNTGGRDFAEEMIFRQSPPEWPGPVAAADIDGDGRTDIVTTDWIFLQRGGRSLARVPTVPEGRTLKTHHFWLADLDGDGNLDLAATEADGIALLENDGSGKFSRRVELPVPDDPLAIIADDLDADGLVDLAVGISQVGILVLRGRAPWEFGDQVLYGPSWGADQFARLDLDRDGLPELLAPTGGSLTVLWGGGEGKLAVPENLFPGMGARRFGALDPDRDGLPDLVLLDNRGLTILRNEGNRRLTRGQEISVGSSPFTLVVGDFDGDGSQDLAVAKWDPDRVALLYGTGAPVRDCNGNGIPDGCELAADCNGNGVPDDCDVSPGIKFSTASVYGGGSAVDAADLDGDGDKDLAATVTSGVDLWANDGQARFSRAARIAALDLTYHVVAADLDGDGDADLAAAVDDPHEGDPDSVVVLRNEGGWTFSAPEPYHVVLYPRALAVADVDRDGDLDLLCANLVGFWERRDPDKFRGDVSVLLNRGDGTFVPGQQLDNSFAVVSVVAADLDGDGDTDLALPNQLTNVSVFLNEGGTFGPPRRFVAGDRLAGISARDLDADGALDLLVGTQNEPLVRIFRNRGDAVFESAGSLPGNGQAINAADLDVDGFLDVVLGNSLSDGSGSFTVFRNDGAAGLSPAGTFAIPGEPFTLTVAEIDGRSGLDIVSTGFSAPFSILRNETGSSVVRDCDGNGVPDECDPDSDGDGVPDACDLCPGQDDRLDLDGDGSPDCLPVPIGEFRSRGHLRAFIRGDSNSSGVVDLSDAVFTLGYLFLGVGPIDCFRALDANDDGVVDISDAVHTLSYLFLGKTQMPPPFPECGRDLQLDELSCRVAPGCART